MSGKEFLMDCLRTFFAAVTLITITILILGLSLKPEEQFGYEAFLAPLIYGAVGTLPNVVMYSKRELKVKELLIRKVIQLILIEVLVLFAAFASISDYEQHTSSFSGMVIGIFLIYVIITGIEWLQNSITAQNMTKDLVKFQKNAEG